MDAYQKSKILIFSNAIVILIPRRFSFDFFRFAPVLDFRNRSSNAIVAFSSVVLFVCIYICTKELLLCADCYSCYLRVALLFLFVLIAIFFFM